MSDPLRVLGTVWDEDKINVVDAARGDFELTLKRLNFVMLKFQPRVAVKIKWDEAERCILMDSDTFHLDGLERRPRPDHPMNSSGGGAQPMTLTLQPPCRPRRLQDHQRRRRRTHGRGTRGQGRHAAEG
uniref:Uncharacterized protein n=2 Tax=Phaeomonas parva TaxID=124430 RepID=A0A6U4KK42_9STRA|mmetsp:Transcript_45081/g.141195  ORF Transcript_45081/g.141195 Transcript_45081/m.141195 type:complete len:129 (+) Transcript_45081:373-759(+)